MSRVKLLIVFGAATASLLSARGDNTNTPSLPATSSTNSWGWITFWSGAKLQDPYNISVTGHTATLTNAHTATDGYLELNLNSRFVLRSGKFSHMPIATPPLPPPPPGSVQFVPFWREMPDIEAKIGYIFRGSSSPTNLSISTIVGSADLYSDVSLGLPILRYESDDSPSNQIKQQVSAELGGGFATDRGFLAVHPNLFLGVGWQGRFPAPNLTLRSLPAFLSGRIGMARIDQPRLLNGPTVALDSLDEPEFNAVWAPSMGFEMVYPINSAVNLQSSGNVYFTAAPASWNLSLGLTLDLGKFFSAFSK